MKGRKWGLSVGAKFLALILMTLLVSVSVIVFNATNLFQKDNLNNIYVASDLLTSAKAGEVRAWINGLIQKGNLIGKILLSKSIGEGTGADEELFKSFEAEADLVSVGLYEQLSQDGATKFISERAWHNPALTKSMNLTEALIREVLESTQIPFERIAAGAVHLSSHVLPDGQPLLIVHVPLVQKSPGVFSAFVTLLSRQDHLLESFSDSGAYTLALVDEAGTVIAHPEVTRVKDRENMSSIPIVRKMLGSKLDREFQEFNIGTEAYLGAYAKVGIAGLGVVNQVPKSRAFEAGQTLIRRSLLIAVLVLSSSFVVAYLFAQTLVSPIRKLSQATEEVAKGNFNIRVAVRTRDEISHLASSFNTMSGEIERKIQNLSKINESSKVISSTLDAEKLIEFALDTLMTLLGAGGGLAWTQDPNGNESAFGMSVARNWPGESPGPSDPIVAETKKMDQPSVLKLGEESALSVPIRQKSGVTGYILLTRKAEGKEFTEEDIFMSGTIMTSVGITFENIDLLKKTADNARMEKELETAKLVQDTMFPPKEIRMSGIEIQSYYTPASECGGDWWGLIPIPGGKALLAIGDATGHGVPAAMVTATAKATCSVIERIAEDAPSVASSPSTVLHFLNKAIFESTRGKILMTFFVAVIDTKTGEVAYSSASHDPIYWYKMPQDATPENGSKNNLDALIVEQGPRLGQNEISIYESATIKMNPNDFLVFYTDGLPEGKNPAKDEYGERKFMRSIGKHAHKPPQEVREKILSDFHAFIESEPLHDDVTLAICKYNPEAA